MARTKRLTGAKILIEDLEYLRKMQTQAVMEDGKARGIAVILHTILKNARRLAGDEMELLDEDA